MIRLFAIPALLLVASAAYADDKPTVSALMKDGYEIKGVFPSNAGPGLILQKADQVMMCFVAETPSSSDVTTQYCKPVR